MTPQILVTGFRPFLGEEENPSELVLQALEADAASFSDFELSTLVLPVEYRGAFAVLREHLSTHDVDAILMLGQASGARKLRLERVALNLMDASAPDEGGLLHLEEVISPGAPIAMRTSLHVRELFAALADPAHFEISNSAGAYVCNSTYFLTLEHLASAGLAIPCLFVHVPPMPSQKLAARADQHPMELATMVAAVRKLLPLMRDAAVNASVSL